MPITACNATMSVLLRCVPLPWRLWHALFSDTTSCIAASYRARDHRPYVRRYQNYIIMLLSDEVPYFIGRIDSLDTPAHPLYKTAFAASPPLAHGTARSQKRDRQK